MSSLNQMFRSMNGAEWFAYVMIFITIVHVVHAFLIEPLLGSYLWLTMIIAVVPSTWIWLRYMSFKCEVTD